MEPPTDPSPGGGPGRRPGPIGLLDPALADRLFREHGPQLRRFLLGIVRDPELAEDVMQATFAKTIESAQGVPDPALKSWLFRVGYHEAITARRRRQSRDAGHRRLAERLGSPATVTPGDELVRGETVEAVRELLSGLPDEQRRVVRERIYEGKTFAEIAAEQGLPLGTVLTRMRRALEKLRRALGPIDDGGGA